MGQEIEVSDESNHSEIKRKKVSPEFTCTHCETTCCTKSNLIRHMKRHSSIKKQKSSVSLKSRPKSVKYVGPKREVLDAASQCKVSSQFNGTSKEFEGDAQIDGITGQNNVQIEPDAATQCDVLLQYIVTKPEFEAEAHMDDISGLNNTEIASNVTLQCEVSPQFNATTLEFESDTHMDGISGPKNMEIESDASSQCEVSPQSNVTSPEREGDEQMDGITGQNNVTIASDLTSQCVKVKQLSSKYVKHSSLYKNIMGQLLSVPGSVSIKSLPKIPKLKYDP